MSKLILDEPFKEILARARRSDLPEVMDLYGDQPTKFADAIEADWLHVLASAQADILEALRMTAPEYEQSRKQTIRKRLALLIVAATAWEKNLDQMD